MRMQAVSLNISRENPENMPEILGDLCSQFGCDCLVAMQECDLWQPTESDSLVAGSIEANTSEAKHSLASYCRNIVFGWFALLSKEVPDHELAELAVVAERIERWAYEESAGGFDSAGPDSWTTRRDSLCSEINIFIELVRKSLYNAQHRERRLA